MVLPSGNRTLKCCPRRVMFFGTRMIWMLLLVVGCPEPELGDWCFCVCRCCCALRFWCFDLRSIVSAGIVTRITDPAFDPSGTNTSTLLPSGAWTMSLRPGPRFGGMIARIVTASLLAMVRTRWLLFCGPGLFFVSVVLLLQILFLVGVVAEHRSELPVSPIR